MLPMGSVPLRLPSADRTARRHMLPVGFGPFAFRYQGNGATRCQYTDTTRKAIDGATTFATDNFYIMKLCSKLLVLYCRNCPKDGKFSYMIPILRKLRWRRTWLIAHWKAHVDFLLTVIELLFYLLPLRCYKAKRVKTHCFLEGVG